MPGGEPLEERGAAPGHRDEDAAAVRFVAAAPHETGRLAAVDEPDGALVADLQALREVRNGGGTIRVPPDEEEQLVLGRAKRPRSG